MKAKKERKTYPAIVSEEKRWRIPFDLEELYKSWHILSWVFLLIGFSILIVNATLFSDDPQLLYGLGLYMVAVTLFNFFLILINLIFLLFLIWKEEGWFYYREYFWSTITYLMAAMILVQSLLL